MSRIQAQVKIEGDVRIGTECHIGDLAVIGESSRLYDKADVKPRKRIKSETAVVPGNFKRARLGKRPY